MNAMSIFDGHMMTAKRNETIKEKDIEREGKKKKKVTEKDD